MLLAVTAALSCGQASPAKHVLAGLHLGLASGRREHGTLPVLFLNVTTVGRKEREREKETELTNATGDQLSTVHHTTTRGERERENKRQTEKPTREGGKWGERKGWDAAVLGS